MMSCKQATELMTLSEEHPLPATRRLALRMHLLICRHCSRYARQLRYLREVVQRLPERQPADPDDRLPEAAKERIKEALQREERG